MDSNHRSKLQQIYSLSPLATRESAHVFNYDTCIVYHNRCDYASIFFNYSEPPHAHSQNRTILVLYRRYAANFAHMCGGWLYSSPLENKKSCCLHASMTHQLFLFSIVLNSYYIFKLKRQPTFGCLLGEGIFTMGYSKNYIMYWGVFTVIIISRL